jgi:hypothetical protein
MPRLWLALLDCIMARQISVEEGKAYAKLLENLQRTLDRPTPHSSSDDGGSPLDLSRLTDEQLEVLEELTSAATPKEDKKE